MKKSTHPEKIKITVLMTDGSSFITTSTINKNTRFFKLEIDNKSHSFWNAGTSFNSVERGGQRARFKKRFEESNFI